MAFPRPLFTNTGRALYGDKWQTPLAVDLGVADRTVRRWIAGDQPVPDGVATDLLRIVTERAADLDDLIEQIKAA